MFQVTPTVYVPTHTATFKTRPGGLMEWVRMLESDGWTLEYVTAPRDGQMAVLSAGGNGLCVLHRTVSLVKQRPTGRRMYYYRLRQQNRHPYRSRA